MKVGDKVRMSERNPNHLGNDVDAYAGMEGIVTDIYDDGAFALDCGSSILVVPMNNAFKGELKGVWIYLNGEHIFHKRFNGKTISNKYSLDLKINGMKSILKDFRTYLMIAWLFFFCLSLSVETPYSAIELFLRSGLTAILIVLLVIIYFTLFKTNRSNKN